MRVGNTPTTGRQARKPRTDGARIEGPVSGNVLLRRAQYRASDTPDEIVRSLVAGKVANQRSVLMRGLRDHGAEQPADVRSSLAATVDRLGRILDRIEHPDIGIDGLRGAEGEAAQLHFAVFDHQIRAPDQDLRWRGPGPAVRHSTR